MILAPQHIRALGEGSFAVSQASSIFIPISVGSVGFGLQETLLTEDLDITAGAKEKASQLKDCGQRGKSRGKSMVHGCQKPQCLGWHGIL